MVLDLVVEVANDSEASPNRVLGTHIRLVHYGAHGNILIRRVQISNDLRDVTYPEQFMCIQELLGAIMREVRGQGTIWRTFPTLVLAGRACLGPITNPMMMMVMLRLMMRMRMMMMMIITIIAVAVVVVADRTAGTAIGHRPLGRLLKVFVKGV